MCAVYPDGGKGRGERIVGGLRQTAFICSWEEAVAASQLQAFCLSPVFSLSTLFLFADARNEHEAGLHFWADPSAPTPVILS